MNEIYLITSAEITDPEDLIGRNEKGRELSNLLWSLRNGVSIQLIGERRSGKSSLINCAIKSIKDDFKTYNAIPVSFNFKSHSEKKGLEEGYQIFLCELLTALNDFKDCWDNGTFQVRNKKITKQKDFSRYVQFIEHGNWPSNKILFSSILKKLIEKGFKVYFFIDEYEYMVHRTFKGAPGALHTLRDAIRDYNDFSCVISGARSWDKYAQDIGSDDFNLIDKIIYVEPLNEEDCKIFVEKALDGCEGLDEELISEVKEKIFSLSGGIPYLMTIICNEIQIQRTLSIDEIEIRLQTHFSNIWDRLEDSYKAALQSNKVKITKIQMNELIGYGLGIHKIGWLGKQQLVPNGSLWRTFVEQQPIIKLEDNKNIINEYNQLQKKRQVSNNNFEYFRKSYHINQLCDQLITLTDDINQTLRDKNLEIIFDTTSATNWPRIFNDIKKSCQDENHFWKFITSIYLIMVESTAKEIKDHITKKYRPQGGARYPREFNRSKGKAPDCFWRIGALRHRWARAHNTETQFFNSKKYTPAAAQEFYIGHRRKPKKEKNDWVELQIAIIQDFIEFLGQLYYWAEAQERNFS